jgi:hypothetical protein
MIVKFDKNYCHKISLSNILVINKENALKSFREEKSNQILDIY